MRDAGLRETAVDIVAPLHGRADAVAIAEIDVVSHADFVAVIHDRRAGQRKQQPIHQLDSAAVVAEQRRQPPADAELIRVPRIARRRRDTCSRALRRSPSPASARRDCGGTCAHWHVSGIAGVCVEDVDDRKAVLHVQRHEQPRHQRKMKRHVAFVAVAEIRDRVFRPLIRFREQHAVRVMLRRCAARIAFRNACVSGRFSQFVPSRS